MTIKVTIPTKMTMPPMAMPPMMKPPIPPRGPFPRLPPRFPTPCHRRRHHLILLLHHLHHCRLPPVSILHDSPFLPFPCYADERFYGNEKWHTHNAPSKQQTKYDQHPTQQSALANGGAAALLPLHL